MSRAPQGAPPPPPPSPDPAPPHVLQGGPDQPRPAPGSQPAAPERRRSFWKELPVLVVIAFAVALLLKTFVIQAFFIPSGSMEPTLEVGDRVLVEKLSYRFGEPERNDVVVFEKNLFAAPETDDRPFWEDAGDAIRELFGFPTGSEQDFIKRVIAVGGDTVEGRNGNVLVNGEPVDEPFVAEAGNTAEFPPQTVPQGHSFVMGDNRNNSDDSRSFGPIDNDEIVGRAFVVIWPLADAGGL